MAKIMHRTTTAKSLIAILFLLLVSEFNVCEAGRPRLFSRSRHRILHSQRVAPSYAETYRYLNWRYPKYTGAFHANYFQSTGVAPGDIGFRGNGVYMTPW